MPRVSNQSLCDKAKVSVAMITYNHENFIAQAIESVLMQETDFQVELILGEDCSTDGSRRIVREYADKYPHVIRALLPEHNLGMQKNGAAVFDACKGEYIACLEGDDYWTCPDKLQKQVEILENNQEYGLVYTDVDFYYQDTGRHVPALFRNGHHRSSDFIDHLVTKGFLAPMTWMFRRDCSPNSSVYEAKDYTDVSFAFLLDVFATSKVFYLDIVTAVRRVVPGSASYQTDKIKKFKYIKGIFDIQKQYIAKYNVSNDLKNQIYHQNYLLLLKGAIIVQDLEFINETRIYFDNLENQFAFLEDCIQSFITIEQTLTSEIDQLRVSKSYRLGRLLLTPCYFMRGLIKSIRNAVSSSYRIFNLLTK